MTEMVIPGTYIEVRAEGLISAGQISTGIVGVVGTASRGPIGERITLSGFSDARARFGLPDPYAQPADGAVPLTLTRALEHIYNNGASGVIAVRVAATDATRATYAVLDAAGFPVATLTASSHGTWGNNIHVGVAPAPEEGRVEGEAQKATFNKLGFHPVAVSAQNRVRIVRANKRIQPLNIIYNQVRDEDVLPNASGRYFLSQTPLTDATVADVQVLDAQGNVLAAYGASGGANTIVFTTSASTVLPGPNQVRISTDTRELLFGRPPGTPTSPPSPPRPPGKLRIHARYGVGPGKPPIAGQVLVTTWNGNLQFADGPAPGDELDASYLVDRGSCVQVTLSSGTTTESYVVPSAGMLAAQINAATLSLVSAAADATRGGELPAAGVDDYFGRGANTPGSDGAGASPDDYASGLDALAGDLVNIVVLAGQDATRMGSQLLGHLNATEQADLERIGVIGAKGATVAEFLGQPVSDGRLVVVAPGLRLDDGTVLPSAYTAAAVAGLISSLPVNGSLTNKALTIPGLALNANRGEQEQLIRRNVLAVVPKTGFRIVKGITSSGAGTPFAAIPTRRIVDFAKYGVRSASDPYIGRLNNDRVRGALKATLDGFLTRMVQDESLTGYVLEVSATRAQEIAGEVSVVMVLQPTFSIEYIRVVMNLQ